MKNKETIEASRWMYNTQRTFFYDFVCFVRFFSRMHLFKTILLRFNVRWLFTTYAFARFSCDLFLFFSQAFLYKNFHQLEYIYGVTKYNFCEHSVFSKKSICAFLSVKTYMLLVLTAYFANKIGCLNSAYCKASHNNQAGENFRTRKHESKKRTNRKRCRLSTETFTQYVLLPFVRLWPKSMEHKRIRFWEKRTKSFWHIFCG